MSKYHWDEYDDWLKINSQFIFPEWPGMARSPYWYRRERSKERKLKRLSQRP